MATRKKVIQDATPEASVLIKELNDLVQGFSQSGIHSDAVFLLKEKVQALYDSYGPVETQTEGDDTNS